MDSTDSISAPVTDTSWDGIHTFQLRVYYEDTDAAGIVYYANYLRFAERARAELLRGISMGHEKMKALYGIEFVVKSCSLDYLHPAFLDDVLEVRTMRFQTKGASVTLSQDIWREDQKLVVMYVKIVARNQATGAAARIPVDVRAAFKKLKKNGGEI